jgi:predicted O-linked N-acetylglucosamine transferase (SPINDLY family)
VALARRSALEAERAALVAEFAQTPLCDSLGFTAALERAYETMLDETTASRTPMAIAADDRASTSR